MRDKILKYLSLTSNTKDDTVKEIIASLRRDFADAKGELPAGTDEALSECAATLQAKFDDRATLLLDVCLAKLEEGDLDTLITFFSHPVAAKMNDVILALGEASNVWLNNAIQESPLLKKIIEDKTNEWMAANTEGVVAEEFKAAAEGIPQATPQVAEEFHPASNAEAPATTEAPPTA